MGSQGNGATHPSASFSATLRAHLDDRPGAFADLARAIADAGGLLGAIDLVRVERGKKVRDVTVLAGDADHIERIVAAARAVPGVEVDRVSDRTFLMHLGGKIEVVGKIPVKTRDDLWSRRASASSRGEIHPRPRRSIVSSRTASGWSSN